MGSGCGSVGKAVASNTSGPQIQSSHREIFYWTFVYCQLYWIDKNKEKEAGNGPLKKQIELLGIRIKMFWSSFLHCLISVIFGWFFKCISQVDAAKFCYLKTSNAGIRTVDVCDTRIDFHTNCDQKCFWWMGYSQCPFLHFRFFCIQWSFQVSDDWIRSEDLCYPKRPPCHDECPSMFASGKCLIVTNKWYFRLHRSCLAQNKRFVLIRPFPASFS